MSVPETLNLTASVDLQAAESTTAKVSILAYTGGVMNVGGWGLVVIDLRGVAIPGDVTLLADHDASLTGIVGSARAEVQRGQLLASGTISRSNEVGQRIIALAKDGVRFQASVGVTPEAGKSERIEAGKSVEVNGRTHVAPAGGMWLIRAGRLREITVTALGADGETSVAIAAKLKGVGQMPDTLNADAIRTEERKRFETIEAVCRGSWGSSQSQVDSLKAQAVSGEIDVPTLQAKLLDVLRASRPTAPTSTSWGGGAVELSQQTLTASLMLRAGHEQAAIKAYGEKVVQQAHDLHITNLPDLCAATLRMKRADVPRDRAEMLKAAFSTVDLPNILSNTLGRSLVPYYMELMSEIFRFATVKSAANFKAQKDIRPSGLGSLEALGAGGEITHTQQKEEDTYDWSIKTWARMLSITRNDIVDDDLGVFDSMPAALSQAAARSLLDRFWTVVLDGQTDGHYSSGNGNLLTTGSALAIGTLGTAVQSFKDQRDNAGNNIGISLRCYHDFDVVLGDPRASLKATGAP